MKSSGHEVQCIKNDPWTNMYTSRDRCYLVNKFLVFWLGRNIIDEDATKLTVGLIKEYNIWQVEMHHADRLSTVIFQNSSWKGL